MSTPFTSSTGRLLSGNPFVLEVVTDDITKQPKKNKDGSDQMETYMLVAFAKGDPGFNALYGLFKTADMAAWPQFHNADGSVRQGVEFAEKVYDGDGFTKKGVHRGTKEGWAGHWVVKFNSQYLPRVVKFDGRTNKWVDASPADLKPGYYVQVDGTTKTNGSTQTAGMYRNMGMVAIIGSGPEIVFGADPNERFGTTAPVLPPGASVVPIAPAAALPPAAGPAAPAAPVAPPAAAPAAPAAPVAPHAGYIGVPPAAPAAPVAPAPPAAPAAPPPPPARTYTMTPAAAGVTREAYLATPGWTDDLLVQHGLMTIT